jgi:hypothetical protein
MIRELDGFVQWLENECAAKRIKFKDKEKIVEAVCVVQNAIEEYKY